MQRACTSPAPPPTPLNSPLTQDFHVLELVFIRVRMGALGPRWCLVGRRLQSVYRATWFLVSIDYRPLFIECGLFGPTKIRGFFLRRFYERFYSMKRLVEA